MWKMSDFMLSLLFFFCVYLVLIENRRTYIWISSLFMRAIQSTQTHETNKTYTPYMKQQKKTTGEENDDVEEFRRVCL